MADPVIISLDEIRISDEPIEAYQSDSMTKAFALRKANFPDEITFHAPGLKRFKTKEYVGQNAGHFTSLSLTGGECALGCEHCDMNLLRAMPSLPAFDGSLYDMCYSIKERGGRGILISGGSDKKGRVPLLRHIPDLIRVRKELDMTIRVHPGLPDEETVAGLAEVDIDGAMVDIIGDNDTIRDVYHLDTTIAEYEAVLERLDRHGVPAIPHIIIGLHFGEMRGEEKALEMIAKYACKTLIFVVLTPLSGTPMVGVTPPTVAEIAELFALGRITMPDTSVMLGCARPMGNVKIQTDLAAIDAGFNGIAYPAQGIVTYAQGLGLETNFIDACCGVQW